MEALVCLLLAGRLLRYNRHSAKGSKEIEMAGQGG